MDIDWSERMSWGDNPTTRTTSPFFSTKEVAKHGRVFYDCFYLDGKRVAVNECVGVATEDDDLTGEETARVLELWQDTQGKNKGHKYFAGRYLFYPRHLPPKHAERRRKRTGIDAKQVYEQCNKMGNPINNPLASVRAVHHVLCCWQDERNRVPSLAELERAHAWFDSAWDDERKEVTPLRDCVDCPSSADYARIRACEICQPVPPPAAPKPAKPAAAAAAGSAPKKAHAVPAAPAERSPAEASRAKPQAKSVPPAAVDKRPKHAVSPPAPPAAAADKQAQSTAPAPARPKAAAAPPKTAVAVPAAPAAETAPDKAPLPAAARASAPASVPRRVDTSPPKAKGAHAPGPPPSKPPAASQAPPAAVRPAGASAAPEAAATVRPVGVAKPTAAAASRPPPASKPLKDAASTVPGGGAGQSAAPAATAGGKRMRADGDAVPDAAAKRPAVQLPFRIPKKADAQLHAAPTAAPASGAPAYGTVSAGGTGPTLPQWMKELRSGGHMVRVWGLPPDLQHNAWVELLRRARVRVKDAALSGWQLPPNAWRCSGVGYLLLSTADDARLAVQLLRVCPLRCPGTTCLRPLCAEILSDRSSLEARDEQLVGHLQLGETGPGSGSRGRDPIVPHFVQSNTHELEMALQWRTLVKTHLLGRSELQAQHTRALAAYLVGQK